jgi:hypothetical protein
LFLHGCHFAPPETVRTGEVTNLPSISARSIRMLPPRIVTRRVGLRSEMSGRADGRGQRSGDAGPNLTLINFATAAASTNVSGCVPETSSCLPN